MFLGRVVADGEPLWTDEDRAWALALLAEEAGNCGGCGQPVSESMDPVNEFAYRVERLRCHACTAVGRVRELDRDEPAGLHHWPVKR